MSFSPSFDQPGRGASRRVLLVVLAFQALSLVNAIALPKRLVLELDGISYRDMVALQAGTNYTTAKGRQYYRRAFNDGYFPASRNVSTFPSTSDVAWTDIFGDRPLPGYQRTYFSAAENRMISRNTLTTSMEHERQVNWQVESGYRRAMAYVYPVHFYKYELSEMARTFLASSETENYYVYIRSTDDAQHMSGDIFAMLGMLDETLKDLRSRYKVRTGRELEILIISDHGNNRAGAGRRVKVKSLLSKAGYRIAKSIVCSNDVVLPTCGIESWVEIHNAPSETVKLAQLLSRLEGVELVTARIPGKTNRFLVINSKGERAGIEWNAANDSFRYSPESGDPLNYRPVMAALAEKRQFDADGFASADSWMTATITNRYPLALERIAQGLTRITLNPATILLSLSNGYVNAGWLLKKGSSLMIQSGTHGGLDDLNSDGIVLSNFTPTKDTSTSRVASQFDDFQGLRNFRSSENGAEWITGKEQALTRIARGPFDSACRSLAPDEIFLRVWTPEFAHLNTEAPVEVIINVASRSSNARIHRWDPQKCDALEKRLTLSHPVFDVEKCTCERAYPLPPDLILEPGKAYRISGRIRDREKHLKIFNFAFSTDCHGMPVAY